MKKDIEIKKTLSYIKKLGFEPVKFLNFSSFPLTNNLNCLTLDSNAILMNELQSMNEIVIFSTSKHVIFDQKTFL
jgi:hypothetical protein